MNRILLFSVLGFIMSCSSTPKPVESAAPPAPPHLPSTIEEAVASSYRTDSNRARDQYRHPAETLSFFGVKPDMTVVEISPSGGWYLEILAPLLAEHGHYIAATPAAMGNAETNDGAKKIADWSSKHPEVAAKMATSDFNPPDKVEVAPAGSADMVLTFRNVHNWMAKDSQRAVFKGFFAALKPGGVLGVVEHRANAKQKRDPKAKSGYVLEKDVIALAQSVGFKLDKKSEINANPKDEKNYEGGVWTLPPTLRLKDKDRERYLAIGESDRMTLRFVKPAKN
jgi:predicted methyltransferase